MKTKFLKLGVVLLLLVWFSSCVGNGPYIVPFHELEGTKWRLAYVNFQDERGRVELEPKDCDTCFTLVFDTDHTAQGTSIVNTVSLVRDGVDVKITTTYLDEPYDGNLYSDLMRSVNRIDIATGWLALFISEPLSRTVVLEFKPLKP